MFESQRYLALMERIDQRLEEQNNLLREMVRSLTGRPTATPSPGAQEGYRIRTDKDVVVVTRAMREEQRRKALEAEEFPHRTPAPGPDFEPLNLSPGSESSNGAPRF